MARPEVWTLAQLRDAPLGRSAAWITPAARAMVARDLPALSPSAGGVDDLDTLIVVGGGALMDRAKLVRRSFRLIVVPSIWGSGAEVSPVAVGEDKHATVDPQLLPDVRVDWPE